MGSSDGEPDVSTDERTASSQNIGGVPNPDAADQARSPGTAPTAEFVERIAGDDVGYAEETGAERRAEEQHTSLDAPAA